MKLKKTLIALSTVALLAGASNAATAPLAFADTKVMSYSVYVGYNHRYLDVTQTGELQQIMVEVGKTTTTGENNSVSLKDGKSQPAAKAASETSTTTPVAEEKKEDAKPEEKKEGTEAKAEDKKAAAQEYPTLPYQGRLFTLGFSAHYNLVNNDTFKFALGGDVALSTGNYVARTQDDAGKYGQESHINVDLGLSAIATLKTDSLRPFVKAGAAYEYGRLFAYHGVNATVEAGVETLSGVKVSAGYTYSYAKAEEFAVPRDHTAPKTLKGHGFAVNVGFTF